MEKMAESSLTIAGAGEGTENDGDGLESVRATLAGPACCDMKKDAAVTGCWKVGAAILWGKKLQVRSCKVKKLQSEKVAK
jgi:hypothetical protein